MKQINISTVRILLLPLLLFIAHSLTLPSLQAQAQDRIPREYTNPDEVVSFDRSTSFQRALDVINEFAQENLNKVIIDRTKTESSIGISIPPMHWRDALDLMLRVKDYVLLEQEDFFEIVTYQSQVETAKGTGTSGQQAQQQGEGEVIATIDSREVRINAIFFEGSRRALREIGVDWSTLSGGLPEDISNYVGGQQGGGGTSGQLPGTEGFEDQFVSVNAKGAQSVSQDVFNSLINFGEIGNSGIEVQALFSAFEADNLGEILASPTVKVMDGQEGRIQVGQDFSIKQRDFAGNVTDQFFSVGTILTVTPNIIEQNDTTVIHLDIQAERSSAQPDPVSTIVNKQTAETQAILVNNEATAIAGLYRSEVSEVRRGIPILKDLPPWLFGLRYLFGFNSEDYQMRELVILVQAEIEPTIQERYGTKLENKFEVLNDERRRIRKEIDEKEEYSPTKMEPLDSSDDTNEKSSVSEEEEPNDTQNTEEGSPAEDEADVEQEKADMVETPDEGDTEEKDVMNDPEMDVEPVPLDLGVEHEDTETAAETDTASKEEEKADTQTTVTGQNETSEEEQKPVTSQSGPDRDSIENFSYFVIAASFTNENNAIEFRDKLGEEGYNAMILTQPDSEFYYVAYNAYKSHAEAKSGLSDIREYVNSEAWLLNIE